MLGLPISTEIRKIITKKKVYEQFGAEMNAERRKKFDADIARMVLTNEVSPVSVNLPAGETVQSLFVLQVFLKAKSFDPHNIAYLAKLFGQRLVLVLEAESCQRIAVWQTRLIMTDWEVPGARTLSLNGLDLDKAWANIVAQIAGINLGQDAALDEQLARTEQRERLQKEIARLEKKARAEKQPKRKLELAQKVKHLREALISE